MIEVRDVVKKIHYADGSKAFFCVKCDRQYGTNSRVHRHYRSVHNDNFYRCKFCREHFTRYDHLKKHIYQRHKLSVACNKTVAIEEDSGI